MYRLALRPKVLSDMISCLFGVKQGWIISPILFNRFLNDLQEYISIGSHGIDLDLVLFAETVVELQCMINRLAEYCDLWHIKMHVLKTKANVFRNGGPLCKCEHWKFKVSNLEVVSYYIILFITKNLLPSSKASA